MLSVIEALDGSLWLRTDQLQLIRLRDGVFPHFGHDSDLNHDETQAKHKP